MKYYNFPDPAIFFVPVNAGSHDRVQINAAGNSPEYPRIKLRYVFPDILRTDNFFPYEPESRSIKPEFYSARALRKIINDRQVPACRIIGVWIDHFFRRNR